jgi:hypothetical protein
MRACRFVDSLWKECGRIARRGVILTLVVAASASDSEPVATQDAGLVLKVKGEWFLGQKAVIAGQTLPAGVKIYHRSQKPGEASTFDAITVVLFDGRLESRSWDKPESWNNPIQLPGARLGPPSRWDSIVTAVMGVFPGHPQKFAQTSVRSPGADLSDAVVELTDGQANIAPVFNRMKKGTYLLLFQPINATDLTVENPPLNPVEFDWQPNTRLPVRVNLQPGLYLLRLLSMHSEAHEPTGAQAWVLLSEQERYGKRSIAFQECIGLTEKWGKEAPDDAVHAFLRAYLTTLARQATR